MSTRMYFKVYNTVKNKETNLSKANKYDCHTIKSLNVCQNKRMVFNILPKYDR